MPAANFNQNLFWWLNAGVKRATTRGPQTFPESRVSAVKFPFGCGFAALCPGLKASALFDASPDPIGEQRIDKEIFAMIAVEDILRVERLKRFLDGRSSAKPVF